MSLDAIRSVFAWPVGLMFAMSAQAQNPIYKCTDGGKITYSNLPCPDAKKVVLKDTKGVNYAGRGSSGR